jgi:hypothetical protein
MIVSAFQEYLSSFFPGQHAGKGTEIKQSAVGFGLIAQYDQQPFHADWPRSRLRDCVQLYRQSRGKDSWLIRGRVMPFKETPFKTDL